MFDEDEATVLVPTFGPGFFFAERYRIDGLLGSGAMGRVYACTELHSERQVALKVLHPDRLGEDETVARFRREAEVLASIGHACIVEIHAFHETSAGIPYIAMELLEGVTLKTRLKSAGRFDEPRDFQAVLDCIAAALEAAHGHGVVHRDLKPDNVFLPATGEPRAKLVDFGLSRMAAQRNDLTRSGMLLGTPRYMAPEQIRNAAEAGPGVDIYSVGILIYESLAGRSPYPADDYGQLFGCVLENRVIPLERERPDLPPSLGEVVRAAMHPDPAQRTASAGALADAFGAAIGSPSRRAEIAQALRPRPRRTTSSNRGLRINKAETLAFDLSAAPSIDERSAPPPSAPPVRETPVRETPVRETPPPEPTPAPLRASLTPAPPVDEWADPVDEGSTADVLGASPAPKKRMGRVPLLVAVALAVVVVLGSCAVGGLGLRALVSGGLPLGF